MKQDKRDRRSLRTRRLVNAAVMDLMLEKRFDTITVQDLLERAGIGRSTFYTHYFDKDDVLASIADEMLATFRQQMSQRDAREGKQTADATDVGQMILPSLAPFQHVQQVQEQYQPLRPTVRGHTGEGVWNTGQMLLSRNIEEALKAIWLERDGTTSPTVPLLVVAQYLAGAFLTLFKWWLEADMPYSPEEMDRVFWHLALPGVRASLLAEQAEEDA